MNTERLINIRDNLELTQTEVAEKLGCTRSAYSIWKINKNTIPLYYLNKFSNIFNINIDYLVNLSDKEYIEFNKVIDKKELGKRIKQARKKIGFIQDKLASKINTTHSVISAYEYGKTSVPTLFLIGIARITNKSLNWFLNKI